jgi:transcriptional regulator with PAS, ATPase and Fis domain
MTEVLARVNMASREQRVLAGFVARDRRMREVVALVERLASLPTTVLIIGETGTGKDLAAHALHYWGARASGPFVKIDCPSIPGDLLESELFGHEPGAFTGAARAGKPGKLELASGGTVLFDRVEELLPSHQAKLLRVIEEKRFERVGGNRAVAVDVRVVASAAGDLKEAVDRGAFRQDLLHRLGVFPIELPPLRERPDDLVPLAEHFLAELGPKTGGTEGFAPSVWEVFRNYSWPGNVRELRSVVERAALLTDESRVGPEALPPAILENAEVAFRLRSGPRPTLAEVEKTYIELTLRHARGNQSRAAAILGISRKSLWEKRRRYRLD